MNKKKILITGIGGLTPRSISRRIRKVFPEVYLIGIDCNYKAIGFFMDNLIDKHYVSPRADDPDYWHFILKVIKENDINLAIVQPESEILEWGRYFEKHGEYPCAVLLPPLKLADNLIDKAKMSEILEGTNYIPKTIKITQDNPKFNEISEKLGFPCWIRANVGSGGLGSLKIENVDSLRSWLFINKNIKEFTVSEFLPGRHFANQMLYYNGELLKNAALECVEYVMANMVPSRVTGNTAYGRFLNDDKILSFCQECAEYICMKLNVTPHAVLSFDLKEDKDGNLKVTEVNARHMAYTGIMADVGFDLISDSIILLTQGDKWIKREPRFKFNKNYIFLRDVDIEPLILTEEIFQN